MACKRTFLFDLYGTLIDIHTDEEQPIAWQELCKDLGEPLTRWEDVKREYGQRCAAKKREQWYEFDLTQVFCEMLSSRGLETDDVSFLARRFRLSTTKKMQLFPCVIEMLDGLRARGAGVYLLSNAQACFTWDEIEGTGLTPYFDGVMLSSEVGWKKPGVNFFQCAFDTFSLDPDRCIYVGNDLHDDVWGASSVGMKTVYILTPQSGVYEMTLPTPTYRVANHQELCELLWRLAEE